ncbi:LysM peptidoglycan-binding domain-containing protein [Bacillus smithii]|uniref:LysM peptidoglycan-binding domain-containing protein n=1 Tax=Bacillus smithii TaxID=1479 RepID=UPI0030C8E746
MKRDPYRELAEKHRKELKLQEWTAIEEEEPKTLSRTEYRKQKKQEKKIFSMLRTLLILFIFLPVAILFGYNTIKEKKRPLSSVSVITEEIASGHDQSTSPTSNQSKKETLKSKQRKTVTHIVRPNETLTDISIHYYGTKDGIDKIKSANHLEDNHINEGQVLKIPLEK